MKNISIIEHIENLNNQAPSYNLDLIRSGILPSDIKKSFIKEGIKSWLEVNRENPSLIKEYHEYHLSLISEDISIDEEINKLNIRKKIEIETIKKMNETFENESNKTNKEHDMVKLAQAIREKNKQIEKLSDSDNYWTSWSKRADNFQKNEKNEVKTVEPVKKIMVSNELINLIQQVFSSFKGQDIVTHHKYKKEVFTPANKENSILKAFEKISSQNNGNPFSPTETGQTKNSEIYKALDSFNRGIPHLNTINELQEFLEKTFNFTMNRYIFNLKNKHEVTDDYFPEMIHTVEHNSNIFAGITYLLYAEYEKQHNAEEKNQYNIENQNNSSFINNKEKFEELLFYVSHSFLKSEEIKTKVHELSKSASPQKQQDFMYELLDHTAELSNIRDKYLLNFDVISSFLEANQAKSQNIINNAQISKIYIPDISTVLSKQLQEVNLASMSPSFLLDSVASDLKATISSQELDKKRQFFFAENERKAQLLAEQSLDYFSPKTRIDEPSTNKSSRYYKR